MTRLACLLKTGMHPARVHKFKFPLCSYAVARRKTKKGWKTAGGERKCLLIRNRFSIKSCFHLGLTAPAMSPTPTVKLVLPLFHMARTHARCKTRGLRGCKVENRWETCDFWPRGRGHFQDTGDLREKECHEDDQPWQPTSSPDRKSGGWLLQISSDCYTQIITCL